MRFPTLIAVILIGMGMLAPPLIWAGVTVGIAPSQPLNPSADANANSIKLYPTEHKHVPINDMDVYKLSGTIMVEHADNTDPTALQTGEVVEKGDVITVYDNSWVIFKSHRGDKVGLAGNSVVTVDECYIEGPDRQIRLLVKKGTLYLRTNGDDSRQSFFELNLGNVVASINNLQAVINYDPAKNFLDVKYIDGKIHVIDQNHDESFTITQNEYNGSTKTETEQNNDSGTPEEHTEHTWLNGKMAEDEPIPLEEIDEINFRRFFDGETLLVPQDNNIELDDSKQVPVRQQ
ncbi:MAG TPA: hypothetical protein VK791_06880 [bacterium]|jgi:hypothetical protein|nr:hypothetical protein [bacterium]